MHIPPWYWFRQWKHWKSQTTQSVSGPGRPAARLLEASPANHLPGFRWHFPAINQPARASLPAAPGRYFLQSPGENNQRSRRSSSSLARRLLNSCRAFRRQFNCAPGPGPAAAPSPAAGSGRAPPAWRLPAPGSAPAWTPTPTPCPGPGGRPTARAILRPGARRRRRPPRRQRQARW